jgi:glutamyl-tRNA reductase
MKHSQLKQLIKEEIQKVLNENIDNSNLAVVKYIYSKIQSIREEMIDKSMDLNTNEDNYEIIEDFVSTEAENAFNILLNEFERIIAEIE